MVLRSSLMSAIEACPPHPLDNPVTEDFLNLVFVLRLDHSERASRNGGSTANLGARAHGVTKLPIDGPKSTTACLISIDTLTATRSLTNLVADLRLHRAITALVNLTIPDVVRQVLDGRTLSGNVPDVDLPHDSTQLTRANEKLVASALNGNFGEGLPRGTTTDVKVLADRWDHDFLDGAHQRLTEGSDVDTHLIDIPREDTDRRGEVKGNNAFVK